MFVEEKYLLAMKKMIKIQKNHRLLFDSRVSAFGLHTSHHRALMHLARKGNLLSQKELAEHLEITPAAVTQILQKLELDGYIKRSIGTDNRYNEIKITERGKEIVDKSRISFATIDKDLFQDFSDDEMNEFISFLDRICENMKGNTDNEKMV